jgi:hypothetical protein
MCRHGHCLCVYIARKCNMQSSNNAIDNGAARIAKYTTHKTPAAAEGIQKVAMEATNQVIRARATCCAIFLRSTRNTSLASSAVFTHYVGKKESDVGSL